MMQIFQRTAPYWLCLSHIWIHELSSFWVNNESISVNKCVSLLNDKFNSVIFWSIAMSTFKDLKVKKTRFTLQLEKTQAPANYAPTTSNVQNHIKANNRICTTELSCSTGLPRLAVCSQKPEDPFLSATSKSVTCSVCFPTPQHLTCRAFDTGSGWRTGAIARLCYQAPASTAACSGAQLPQNLQTDTPGAPAQPTLGRKAYVLLVLEHQHKPRRGKTTC